MTIKKTLEIAEWELLLRVMIRVTQFVKSCY